MYFFPAGPEQTLFILSFTCNLDGLGWLTRFFFKKQPEIEFPLSGSLTLMIIDAIAEEAHQCAQTMGRKALPLAKPLHQFLEEQQILKKIGSGQLTIGRLKSDGNIFDITTVTGMGAPREEVWKAVENPKFLEKSISFVTRGRMIEKDSQYITGEVIYGVKIGPFTKTYKLYGRSRYEEPIWAQGVDVCIDGHPIQLATHLFDYNGNTYYCHTNYMDLKNDWLSRIFFKYHPEFEAVASIYQSVISTRAIRIHFGPPQK